MKKTCARIFPAAFRAFCLTYFLFFFYWKMESNCSHTHAHVHTNRKQTKKTCNNFALRSFHSFFYAYSCLVFLFFLGFGSRDRTQGCVCVPEATVLNPLPARCKTRISVKNSLKILYFSFYFFGMFQPEVDTIC